jgi:predicted transcriptional regulator
MSNEPEEKTTDYGTVKTVRLRKEDVARLDKLTQALGTSEAGVIRQALRRLAQAEGLE